MTVAEVTGLTGFIFLIIGIIYEDEGLEILGFSLLIYTLYEVIT